MSLCRLALWSTVFPDREMPEGCTYWQFNAMRAAYWAEEGREFEVTYLQELEKTKQWFPQNTTIITQIDDLINQARRRISE